MHAGGSDATSPREKPPNFSEVTAEVTVPAALVGALHRCEAFSCNPGSKIHLRRIPATETLIMQSESSGTDFDTSVDMARKMTLGVPTYVPTSGDLLSPPQQVRLSGLCVLYFQVYVAGNATKRKSRKCLRGIMLSSIIVSKM